MIQYLLILAVTSSSPTYSRNVVTAQIERPDATEFFDPGNKVHGRHYLVLDQRGIASAKELSNLLEEAFGQFEDLLHARPKVKASNPLRVEVLSDAWNWRKRLRSLGIDPAQTPGFAHYDPGTGSVVVQADEIDYRTRARLLGACLRQFHHLCKRKNDDLVGNWFVTGLSELVSMHRWDGKHLETRAKLRLSTIDTPAMALDAMMHRQATMHSFTSDFLESGPMAWTLTSFLMEGEGGKHRKRFQKFALGYRGSMLDGEQMALSLGSPDRVIPAIEGWLRSAQLPLEVFGGDFEDLGGGRLVGTAHENVGALASPRGSVSRMRCVLDIDDTQGAGFFFNYESPYSFTYVMIAKERLWTFEVKRGAHQDTDHFRQPPIHDARVEFEAVRTDGWLEMIVNGESIGSIAVEGERMGLIVQVGSVTVTELEWE